MAADVEGVIEDVKPWFGSLSGRAPEQMAPKKGPVG